MEPTSHLRAPDDPVQLATSGSEFLSTTRPFLVASVGLILMAAVLQIAILPSAANLIATGCAAATSLFTFFYLFGRQLAMVRRPLSSLALLGLSVSSLSGPLAYQSLVLQPITANLSMPVETFAYVGLFQLTLVICDLLSLRTHDPRLASFVIGSGS